MRRTLCALILLLGARLALGAATEPSTQMPADAGPWVVRAYFDDKAQLNLAARRSPPWEVNHAQRFAVLEVANRFDYSQLLAQGFRVGIDPDLTLLLRDPAAALRTLPGFGCYRTVEETLASIDQLVAAHPTLASSVDIGDSWEKTRNAASGYDLRVLKLTHSAIPGPKPRLFVVGALHAREYSTAETVMRFGEWLLARYPIDADVRWMLDHHELHLLPQANPDARKKAEAGLLWRKNVNEAYCGATSNLRGADLNRNFPFEWGAHNGSSGEACDESFRGPSASSEPETAAITSYVASLYPDLRPADLVTPAPADRSGVFLDVHSYGELVMWPWGFDATLAPNGAAMRTLGRRLGHLNGYRPQQGVELYVTDGGTRDFAYGELGVPALSFELGTSFFEPCDRFEGQILDANFAALAYLLRVARRPYLEPAGPSIEGLGRNLAEVGEPVRVVGLANDAAYNQANGSEPVNAVAGVDLYLAQLPWNPDAEPRLARAADGNFDGASEWFHADLLIEDDAPGSHGVFLRARDDAAYGPAYAASIDVVAPGSSGRVTGELRNANTGSLLAVPAVLQLGSSTTLALPGEQMQFALRALPGSYSLKASAQGYAPLEVAALSLVAGQSLVRNLNLVPVCSLIEDSASAGLGNFSAQPPWGIGTARYLSAPAAFTDSPDGDYAANADTALTLVPLDLRDVSNVHLAFQSWCDTEAGFDRGRVEISTNGSLWTEVWSCSGNAQWQQVELSLGALDDAASAYIRFRLTSDGAVQREGWSIDDLVVTGAGAVCGGTPDGLFVDGFE